MHVQLISAGKRFNKEWILININQEINSGEKYAVLGANGSGKSSFIKLVSGYLMPSQGKIIHSLNGQVLPAEQVYLHISICAPYLEFTEAFSVDEILGFHKKLKPTYSDEIITKELINCGLHIHKNKAWGNLSSGMKQRLRLIIAILNDCKLLLLDEPCANLDSEGTAWYKTLIKEYTSGKTVLVGSNNQHDEFEFCTQHIHT